jgi:phospholipid/cholesterol/gamma-HCH transport system substrate-binding protein
MRKVSHFKIGLFILVCTFITFGALIWIGAADLFKQRRVFVTYFADSVGGLAPGSSVSYLGVPVGKVTSISIAPDDTLIQVLMEIDTDFRITPSLAAQLQFQGLTGQRKLGLVKAPPDLRKVTPAITFPVTRPLIPSCPGELSQAEKALNQLGKQLSQLDLQGLVTDLRKATHGASEVVAGNEMKETLHNVRELSTNLKVLSQALGGPQKREEMRQAVEDVAASAAAARQASQSLSAQLASLPPGALGNITKRVDAAVATGERAVGKLERQAGGSLVLLQQDLMQLNGILEDLERLIRTMENEPGRVFTRPESREPFRR